MKVYKEGCKRSLKADYVKKLQRLEKEKSIKMRNFACEFGLTNSNNRLVEALRKWVLEQQLRREIEEAKRTYEKEFSGEDIPEDLALLDLLADINSAIPEEIEKKLEEKGFILTKDGKRYFTNWGHEIATALKEFNETVLERGS